MPPGVREGAAGKVPFLAIDGLQGLVAMVQMAAIELHAWGATEADPLHPDRLVFDLDPGEGVSVADIAAAALEPGGAAGRVAPDRRLRTRGGPDSGVRPARGGAAMGRSRADDQHWRRDRRRH